MAKTYGPVRLEQIRQWLAKAASNSRTPVFVDGAKDWTFRRPAAGIIRGFAPARRRRIGAVTGFGAREPIPLPLPV